MSQFYPLGKVDLPESDAGPIEDSKPLVEVKEEKDRIEISFRFPGFDLTSSAKKVAGTLLDFKEVGISGAGFISESGKPLLPAFGKFVQIPAQHDFDLDIDYGEQHEFKEILITPAQEAALDGPEAAEFEYDPTAYSDEELYPRQVVTCGAIQYLDNYKVLPIYIHPLQYNAANKVIRAYEQVKVIVKFKPKDKLDDEENEQFVCADPSGIREVFGNLLLNPARPRLGVTADPAVGPLRIPSLQKGPELLIIYDDKLKVPAEKLAHWKNQCGLITASVAISQVGNSVVKIKTQIRNRRRALFSRLRYVLLFGDVNAIVAEETGGATTDHYYYTSREASDANDCVLPWVSGGRIPVSDVQKADKIVDQIIRYEKEPPRDPNYYNRMTFAAYFQDRQAPEGNAERAYIKTMESIRNHMTGLGIEVDRVYVSDTPNPQNYLDGTPVPAEVRESIVNPEMATYMLISDTSEGQMIIGHRDHGSSEGWAHPSFTNRHLEAIVSRYPSIFFSINCLTGQFDRNPRDSFAESILALDGGAPSLVAATELSGTWRNDSMMKAMFDALWPGMIPTFPGSTVSYAVRQNRLGDILNYAKAYLLVAHGSNSGVKHHLEIYHVIGDPTLHVWSEAPKSVNLLTRVVRDTVHIWTSTCPRDAVLTLWDKDKLIRRIKLTSTRVSIPLRELRLTARPRIPVTGQRQLSVCFSAPAHLFAQTQVRV
jgi:hypothetical protein